MRRFFLFLSLFFIFSSQNWSFGQTATSSGIWNSTVTWGGPIPATGGVVVIPSGITVNVDINTSVVGDVTVNGTLIIDASAIATLNTSGGITVNVNASLVNNGGINFQTPTKNFILGQNATYTHNPFNVAAIDESIFTNSNESFDPTSNLIIQKWYDLSIPLGSPSRVQSSNFGNVTLSVPTGAVTKWDQDGYFAINRIKGTFTVTLGIVMMDDGTGNSTTLTLQTVSITNAGCIIFQAGQPRTLNLTTGNFTDNSASIYPTIILDSSYSALNWNVNGNLNLSHDFNAILGTGFDLDNNNIVINVTGKTNITGGACELIKMVDVKKLIFTVSDTTTISGSPTKVRFIDGNNGELAFTTNYFVISGGLANTLLGGNLLIPPASGIVTVTVNNDLIISGSTVTYIANSDPNINKVRVIIGRDFIMNSGNPQFTTAFTKSAQTLFQVGRNFTINSGQFIGQGDSTNAGIDSIIVGANFYFGSPTATDFFRANCGNGSTVIKTTGNFTIANSGTSAGQGVIGIYQGAGNITFSVTGQFLQNAGNFNGIYNSKATVGTGSLTFTTNSIFKLSGGIFKGINNTACANFGTITFNANSFDFEGGYFCGYYTVNMQLSSGTGTFVITNNCLLNYANITDSVMFLGLTNIGIDENYLALNLSVGGDLTISGANGVFISSFSRANETINITGNVNISSGTNIFNPYTVFATTFFHNVTMLVGGNFSVAGGNTFLSNSLAGILTSTINGNYSETLGTLTIQGGYLDATMNILGGYTQSGGIFYLHNGTTPSTNGFITVTINSDDNASGDFVHNGGTINFDSYVDVTSSSKTMVIKSPNVSLGIGGTNSGSMTQANPGTGTVFGILQYSHGGTTNFMRGGTHDIQQVKQSIISGTTIDVISGNVQVMSHVTPATTYYTISFGATLALRTNQIYSNSTQANSGINIFGRLRIQHPQGFYNGTSSAALSSVGNMNYINVGTIEYCGVDNQIITGDHLGIDSISPSILHDYYNLEINFGGTPDVEFVYPTNIPTDTAVHIRNNLILTSGELNLDNDHINTSGGRSIIIENALTTAITRNSGYIRSEVIDGSGKVKWKIGTTTGNHIIPFGYSSAAPDYIPFSFGISSGNADTLTVATYHTVASNTPFPPTVNHVRNYSGADNSSNTVDRFWYLKRSATTSPSNLAFRCTPAELGSIASPRAQRWIAASNAWEMPQGVQANIAGGDSVTNAPNLTNWWTLADLSSPLPVELVSFTGECVNNAVQLKWITSSEINNDYFTINRSSDGVNYEDIGTKDGHGNSTSETTYEYTDANSLTGINYYKLIQKDFDGKEKEYGPVLVKSCKELNSVLVAVARSDNSNSNILVHSPYSGKFKMTVFDLEGKELMSADEQIATGENIIKLNTSVLSEGIYFVRMQSEYDIVSKKFLVSHN